MQIQSSIPSNNHYLVILAAQLKVGSVQHSTFPHARRSVPTLASSTYHSLESTAATLRRYIRWLNHQTTY
ncbi:uncharacterized protein LAJ45_09830 [Morchella importuna]|uniref:uncharacterized protein n=1 Tax=Morchella importuna TaxID=1174673 RepID=UPI001E8D0955|nr:uncharacterized protein LAJ45_09830 [Morchella importuna]KAH8146140.1 hypothetical protein LAJ45_09830 [Morchella importuna]